MKHTFKFPKTCILTAACLALATLAQAQYNRPDGPSTDPKLIELEKPTIIPEIKPEPPQNAAVKKAPNMEEPDQKGMEKELKENQKSIDVKSRQPQAGSSPSPSNNAKPE